MFRVTGQFSVIFPPNRKRSGLPPPAEGFTINLNVILEMKTFECPRTNKLNTSGAIYSSKKVDSNFEFVGFWRLDDALHVGKKH